MAERNHIMKQEFDEGKDNHLGFCPEWLDDSESDSEREAVQRAIIDQFKGLKVLIQEMNEQEGFSADLIENEKGDGFLISAHVEEYDVSIETPVWVGHGFCEDGTDLKGNTVPEGTYYFTVMIGEKEFVGHVTLVR